MVRTTCNGCTRLMLVRPPSLEMIVKTLQLAKAAGASDKKTGLMIAAITPLIPMIPAEAMEGLPKVMQIYCPDCTGEILQRAEREENNGTEYGRSESADGSD